ncbi:hypothetical protein P4N68_06065 [Corynebacterium felinum]|uniref:DUF3558 domain-containing protein n=1 Tax=Corynebacterium felinum TaxID=131318 RepID=A0ABU2B4I8_9CORY|nr:hypothetical protein [Corynebacterium felinum]MDF5820644.1 hypothetical protein [Corynebacterium felinum]MDR7353532.1 hypothetical protein [Corynebacterium felinum]WJY95713.1 hypothetical protein CFELI_10575 [Corynebacterium felinum]
MRTRILTALATCCAVTLSGCTPPQDTQSAHSTTTEETYPFETWESPPKPSMIPLPPDREYVEAFDKFDPNNTLYDLCDTLTPEQLADIGFEKATVTSRDSSPFIDCGMRELPPVKGVDGFFNVSTHFARYSWMRDHGLIIDATFPGIDERIYFSNLPREDENIHCDAAISTKHGRISVTFGHTGKAKATKDELCWKAYEILEKLRTKGNFT